MLPPRFDHGQAEEKRKLVPPEPNTTIIPLQYVEQQLPKFDYSSDYDPSLKGMFHLMNDLNEDCVFSICEFLPSSALCALILVSKYWRQIIESDRIWWQVCKRRGWGVVKLDGISIKESYLNVCKELIINRAEHEYASTFVYYQLLSTCHPPRRPPAKQIYLPKDPIVSSWPKHPNDVHPYNPSMLVTELDIDPYPEFYLQFELDWLANQTLQEYATKKPVALTAIYRYVQFMKLKAKYPEYLLIPTHDIFMVWISHLIRPEKYESDCEKVFRFSSLPELPTSLSILDPLRTDALESTASLWQKEYSEMYIIDPVQKESPDSCFLNRRYQLVDHHRGRYAVQVPGSPPYVSCKVPTSLFLSFENPISISEEDIMADRQFITNYKRFVHGVHKIRGDTVESYKQVIPDHKKNYERFMYLVAKDPKKSHKLYPTYAADLIWHAHMLHPSKYREYCMKYLGFVLVHDPTGLPDAKTERQLKVTWETEYKETMDTGKSV